MKVLMVNSVCGYGSTGRICTDLADALIANGHECKIAYGRGQAPEKYQDISYKICSNINVYSNVILSRIFDNEGFNGKSATLKFIKWIKEYDPDVIHLHNLHGYYINVEILFKFLKTTNAKIIWTLHDCWTFTGHCAHYQSICCDKWKSQCCECKKKKSYPSSYLLDNSFENFNKKKRIFNFVPSMTIVTPSEWLMNEVKSSFLKNYDVKVINNGIDLDIFKNRESDFSKKNNLENKKIILGVASSWGKNKGLYDFYKLSEEIDDDTKIVLVGLSPKQLSDLPSKIFGIERTSSVVQLAEIYSCADLFFNPTYQDTYPTVNLEAQACGTPVITYKTGGSSESVPHENVIDVGDYKKVIDFLKVDNININSDISTTEQMLDEYLKVYEE